MTDEVWGSKALEQQAQGIQSQGASMLWKTCFSKPHGLQARLVAGVGHNLGVSPGIIVPGSGLAPWLAKPLGSISGQLEVWVRQQKPRGFQPSKGKPLSEESRSDKSLRERTPLGQNLGRKRLVGGALGVQRPGFASHLGEAKRVAQFLDRTRQLDMDKRIRCSSLTTEHEQHLIILNPIT